MMPNHIAKVSPAKIGLNMITVEKRKIIIPEIILIPALPLPEKASTKSMIP